MGKEKWRYGVILDAGSSGTRIHIYRWLDTSAARANASPAALHSLPVLETKDQWTQKTHPGVSTFGATPELVGPDHLKPLFEHALEYIPKDTVRDTPLFVLGTAGMRLLPDLQRSQLLKEICSYTKSQTQFLISDCDLHIQVIPGETEGLYGWIAANYLLGGFDNPEEHAHGKGHHTYGFLDMGGASAQIAFAPNATEAEKHANDLKLLRLRTTDGIAAEYRVFVTTWLGFGANEARRRYVDALVTSVGGLTHTEIPDPCLPAGLQMTTNGTTVTSEESSVEEPHLLGTGIFEECLQRTYPLLEKDAPCLDEPCLLNGVHVPAIDFDVNHFIGISEYWHTTHEVFEMGHKDKAYDFNTYQTRVKDFCSQDWSAIQKGILDKTWGKKVDEQTAYEVCFKASWLISVLHDGIGIPRVGLEDTNPNGLNGTKDVLESGKEKGFLEPFQAVNKIKSTEVSWTLGKMVLYAASQVPPLEDDSPVGFGSNEPGIPADFQYPGGSLLTPTYDGAGHHDDDSSITNKIHDTLFNSDSPRRIPGFLLFMFIVSVVLFLACGRERRSRLYRKVFGSSSKNNGFFGRKVPPWFRNDFPGYERGLEDGGLLEDPNNFELGGIDSDDSEGTSGVMRPGQGTPRSKALALSPEVLDRRGMVVRTESRERLNLSKSRTGSPTRLKSNMSA